MCYLLYMGSAAALPEASGLFRELEAHGCALTPASEDILGRAAIGGRLHGVAYRVGALEEDVRYTVVSDVRLQRRQAF